MVRLLAGVFLMARVACHRLDVNWELCLHFWQTRPVIEVVLESPEQQKRVLAERLDAMFPF